MGVNAGFNAVRSTRRGVQSLSNRICEQRFHVWRYIKGHSDSGARASHCVGEVAQLPRTLPSPKGIIPIHSD